MYLSTGCSMKPISQQIKFYFIMRETNSLVDSHFLRNISTTTIIIITANKTTKYISLSKLNYPLLKIKLELKAFECGQMKKQHRPLLQQQVQSANKFGQVNYKSQLTHLQNFIPTAFTSMIKILSFRSDPCMYMQLKTLPNSLMQFQHNM